jgi:hypothetical protein
MQGQTAATHLLTAHEHDRLELRTEVDALKASLKQLRADMLVSFKHAAMLNKSAPDSRIPSKNSNISAPAKLKSHRLGYFLIRITPSSIVLQTLRIFLARLLRLFSRFEWLG